MHKKSNKNVNNIQKKKRRLSNACYTRVKVKANAVCTSGASVTSSPLFVHVSVCVTENLLALLAVDDFAMAPGCTTTTVMVYTVFVLCNHSNYNNIYI